MPEYFFHVSLELFSEPQLSSYDQTTPLNLSLVLKSLKPFLRSPRPQNTRDTKFDTHKRSSVPKSHVPSKSLFERTIAEQIQPSSPSDDRLDHILVECADMDQLANEQELGTGQTRENHIEKGMGTSIPGAQTKGRYSALRIDNVDEEWGIVHLYRDASETPGLYKDNPSHVLGADIRDVGNGVPVPKSRPMTPLPPARDEECTTLCILAVPSYLAPADFLAFVGEKTRDQVSHFRMIRTNRQNRYMVLMKFRNGKRAREWQADWNGRVFNSMEPETVHVVFLKSVEVMPATATAIATTTTNATTDIQNGNSNGTSTFPSITNDPFITSPVPPTAKPLAPRTPSLIELPTCPVCLERMDETTGLLTILCQHVFHCTCLQKWSGGGCPVCRYTHDDFSTRVGGGSHKYKSKSKSKVDGYIDEYEVSNEPLECEVCHAEASLWQCLICGKVGCGRYEGKHAYTHFEETGHTFAMDLDSKRVWDYAGDVYVHRIIQDAAKPGEKLVELPGRRREATALEDMDEDVEVAKMENIAVEYTHLLTSQLESQRVYFEEIVERAVDKAFEASKKADRATEECEGMRLQLRKVFSERDELLYKKVPDLESERNRFEKRVTKFEDMAKSVNTRYLEEKSLASSLMERIKYLEDNKLQMLEKKIQALEEDNATKDLLMEGLRDEHRDAMMQISAQEKLREMVVNGELDPEDLVGATIEAGPVPIIRKGKRAVSHKKDATASAGDVSADSVLTSLSAKEAPSSVEDELARVLRVKLGLDAGHLQKVQGWDEEKAGRLFGEFRAKMLEEGLLAEGEKRQEQVSGFEDQAGEAETKVAKRKKKKGKGKR